MSKKSIIDVMGRAEAFRLMEEAAVAAAKKNKAAGVTTASHINGRTVFVTPKDNLKRAGRRKTSDS